MKQKKVHPDVVCYSAAISACSKGKQWSKAWGLFVDMEKRKVSPNLITFNALISACEDSGRALDLLAQMESRGIQPDRISFSTAISVCEKAQEWERAIEYHFSLNLVATFVFDEIIGGNEDSKYCTRYC